MDGLTTAEATERLARAGPNALPELAPEPFWRRCVRLPEPADLHPPGDAVRLEAGDRVPADGLVMDARGAMLDESILTGESIAVDKSDGDEASSGTLLVRGKTYLKVTRTGRSSDAPALKRSDVGVAMGQRGSDVREHPEVPPLPVLDQSIGSAARSGRRRARIRHRSSRHHRRADADGLPALALAFDRTPGVMQQAPRPANSPLLDRPSVRFVAAAGSMKAVLALAVLGILPLFGYSLDVTRAAAFHFMAVAQLFLTYPSRHTRMHPLPNAYLHAAVIAGVGIQVTAASLPFTSGLLGEAAIPVERWGVVFGGAFLAWGLAEACARLAWRHHGNEGGGR